MWTGTRDAYMPVRVLEVDVGASLARDVPAEVPHEESLLSGDPRCPWHPKTSNGLALEGTAPITRK